MKTLALLFCISALACASSITSTTTCTSLTTITDPALCTLTDGLSTQTADYSDTGTDFNGLIVLDTIIAPTGADDPGASNASSFSWVMPDPTYTIAINADAVELGDGTSTLYLQIGGYSYSIVDYGHIQFVTSSVAGDTLAAELYTTGDGWADIGINYVDPPLAGVPEPGSIALMGAGLIGLFLWRKKIAA